MENGEPGEGRELTALFADVFAWKTARNAAPAAEVPPRKMSLDEIRDSCTVDGKVDWEGYWEKVAKQSK